MNMKNLLAVLFLFAISIAIVSCSSDSTTNPVDNTPTTGSVYITSNPAGAQIFQNGTNSGKVTPDSLTGLQPGTYNIKLVKDGFRDTLAAVTVTAGKKSNLTISLTSNASLTTYTGIRVFESNDVSATDPSGIILSTGKAASIAGTSPDRPKVDIYYSSDGYVIASANVGTTMTRKTYFYVGSSTNINDHVAAPTYSSTSSQWTTSIKVSTTTNYVFLYDQDKHYSKFKIDSEGTNPNAYANVEWIYNNTVDDPRF